jgi:hypothetical protein
MQQPQARRKRDAQLFLRRDAASGAAEGQGLLAQAHFNEHQMLLMQRDQVDFAALETYVARQNSGTLGAQEMRGQSLGACALIRLLRGLALPVAQAQQTMPDCLFAGSENVHAVTP